MSDTMMFCNSQLRPNCQLTANLCCMVCIHRTSCIEQNRAIKSSVMPCEPDEEFDDDVCEFAI